MTDIKTNAPEGATHYLIYNNHVSYYKSKGRKLYFWNSTYWAMTYRYDIDIKPL